MDQSILISKLEHMGVRGPSLEIFQSYFNSRRQHVVFHGAESYQHDITVGVPQGSILGPLFFFLYVLRSLRTLQGLHCFLSTSCLLMIPTLQVKLIGLCIRKLGVNWVNCAIDLHIINYP